MREIPYCHICEEEFNNKHSLQIHLNRHTKGELISYLVLGILRKA